MLQSQLFTKTRKSPPKDEAAKNAQLLIRAGYIDKLHAGVYSYLPLGLRVLKRIEGIIREEMNAAGGQEVLLPALQPKEPWRATGRWEGLEVLYKVRDASDREYALGPTHEEVIVPLAKQFIQSYKDLPFAAYQIQTKFRMELRSKSGILRGREFLMKDLYSFHRDEADLDTYYEAMKGVYERIFDRVGIGNQTFLTFASGGTFSKYSHEFQTLTASGEDTICLCEKCELAVNEEIWPEVKKCPGCGRKNGERKTAIEVGNIFKLGTKYTEPFALTYKNADGADELVVMGCYGIGLGRLMGAVVEVLSDDAGLVWPVAIAPFDAHLVALFGRGEDAVKKLGGALYEQLERAGIPVLYDDRAVQAGEKLAGADLLGIPVRLVVSSKTGSSVELKERTLKKTELLSIQEVISRLREIRNE